MYKKWALLALIPVIFSCSDNDDDPQPGCGVNDPTEELEWLKNEIAQRESNITEDSKYCYIAQADLDGQTVFVYWDCNPLINKVIPVFDCAGDQIGVLYTDISPESLKEETILWKTEDFVCDPA